MLKRATRVHVTDTRPGISRAPCFELLATLHELLYSVLRSCKYYILVRDRCFFIFLICNFYNS